MQFGAKMALQKYAAKIALCSCGCGKIVNVASPYAMDNGNIFATRACWDKYRKQNLKQERK